MAHASASLLVVIGLITLVMYRCAHSLECRSMAVLFVEYGLVMAKMVISELMIWSISSRYAVRSASQVGDLSCCVILIR